jgi:hypothetical protein
MSMRGLDGRWRADAPAREAVAADVWTAVSHFISWRF